MQRHFRRPNYVLGENKGKSAVGQCCSTHLDELDKSIWRYLIVINRMLLCHKVKITYSTVERRTLII